MIYKKQFSQLHYTAKRDVIFRFIFLLCAEMVANSLFYRYCFSISIFPIFFFIFSKKYFSFISGALLFGSAFIIYFTFSGLSCIPLLIASIFVFLSGQFSDFDKLSATFAYLSQTICFLLFDNFFCIDTLLLSSTINLGIIFLAKLDIVPTSPRIKETVFL